MEPFKLNIVGIFNGDSYIEEGYIAPVFESLFASINCSLAFSALLRAFISKVGSARSLLDLFFKN
jgi:hypothetical protein